MPTMRSRVLASTVATVLVTGLAQPHLGSVHAQVAPAWGPTQCTADFSGTLGRKQVDIQIRARADQRYDARVDGTLSGQGLVPLDERVRPGLDLQPNVYGAEYGQYNSAERSLVALHGQAELAHLFEHATPPFAPSAVRRVRTFDLTGQPDKFGGHVLLEAYGDGDALLGRLVRRMVTVPCR
ncbi:MAG: hypothetical protein RI988_2577 [Pseudomonadota bacterium]|jgi:hypothetical protein